jgi:hypothetical protein
VEVLPGRLSWVSASYVPRPDGLTYYFSIEQELVYSKVNYETGPLHIGHCAAYIAKLH